MIFRIAATVTVLAVSILTAYAMGYCEARDVEARRVFGGICAAGMGSGLAALHRPTFRDPFGAGLEDHLVAPAGMQQIGFLDAGTGVPRRAVYAGPPINSWYGGVS